MFSLGKNIYQQHGLVFLIQGNHFGLLCSASFKKCEIFRDICQNQVSFLSQKYLNVVVVVVVVVVVIVVVVVVVVLLLFCWREEGL